MYRTRFPGHWASRNCERQRRRFRFAAPRDRHFGEYPDRGPPRQVVAV